MTPRIETLMERKLAGKRINMSFAQNKTADLWRSFMPQRPSIKHQVNNYMYSVEVFSDIDFFKQFNPNTNFEKWAAIEVSEYETLPNNTEQLILPEGLYAVFNYKGKASEAAPTYQYIYTQWLPNSEYVLDHRPHFALMGEKYKNEHPDSEEELWIPIKLK